MKKRILSITVAVLLFLNGCQSAPSEFMLYQDTVSSSGYSTDSRLTAGDLFAENLVVIPKEEDIGNDEQLTSSASLLVDITDHKVVYADHVYDRLYPASLTKLMTALIAIRYGELTDMVTFSNNASHITEIGAKVCGFEEGDTISLEALLNSMLVYSGNDAAIAIAEHVGGSVETFAQMMNDEAVKIGAVHTNFVNPNGLHDDNQYTTAYDLYLIFNELIQYDTARSIIKSSSYEAEYTDKDGNSEHKTFDSTILYLDGEKTLDPVLEVIGGKSGTTSKAGNCLVLLVKDSQGKEYVAVILKASGKEALYSQMTYLLTKASLE